MQRHVYEHFNLQGHLPGFLNDLLVTLINKTDPIDSTKREDLWIQTLKTKAPWDLMLKIVFRCNILYFASLLVFMDGLFLDNDFRTWFSYFIISIAVVSLGFFLQFHYSFIFLLIIFVAMFGIFLLSCIAVLLFMFVTYIYQIMLLFVIALPWIILSYLLIVSLIKFPYSIIIMTMLWQIWM